MHVILGATGRVGSAVARRLIDRHEPVTVVSRDAERAAPWKKLGARVAILDVRDTAALRAALEPGSRVFALNPPADPTTDTDAEERATVRSIASALASAANDRAIERVVALSTYGAQPGENIGDLGVLCEMEQRLARLPVPVTVVRAAYFMSNWDHALDTARDEGKVQTFFPADFRLPMVAPRDIGAFVAELLLGASKLARSSQAHVPIRCIEGPARWTPADVADAFGRALGREVIPVEIPPKDWRATFEGMGFSPRAAASYAGMTKAAIDADAPDRADVVQGETSLGRYIDGVVVGRPAA
jgi:uncharacterized protein YbjT (DUF2867 family)